MALYKMTYTVGGIRGDITLDAASEEDARDKAKKTLATYIGVEEDSVKIGGVEKVAEKKVAA